VRGMIADLIRRYRRDLWQMTKFSIVGVGNTGVDFGLFTLLYLYGGIFYATAQVISYGCAVLHSYLWNRYWTFARRGKPLLGEAAKFLSVNLASLAVALVFLYLFREKAQLSTLWAKAFATVFSMMVNYGGNRFWVFALKSQEK